MERKIQQLAEEKPEFAEEIIEINRVSRTVKGGRRIRFRVLAAVGNRNGRVGIGVAKAGEVPLAAAKASKIAKENFISVPIVRGTIPHRIQHSYQGTSVFLKPAKEGSSIAAGGVVRTIISLAGVKNISSKTLGSNNKINNAKAVIMALKKLRKNYERNQTSPSKIEADKKE